MVEMIMLRWMSRITTKDKIKSDYNKGTVKVEPIGKAVQKIAKRRGLIWKKFEIGNCRIKVERKAKNEIQRQSSKRHRRKRKGERRDRYL